ncbi:MAG: type II TA system antitoxin MqsA family protein [Calditrichaceae bacterium]
MSDILFCSTCETDKYLQFQTISTEFVIKGKKFPYTYDVQICEKCGEYVSSPDQNDKILKDAYDSYKLKNGLLLTDEIMAIRKKYDLSLRDFSKILGVSHITYHRYEKGAPPDPALNNLLLLIQQNPENLQKLYDRVRNTFSPKFQAKIESALKILIDEHKSESCSGCYYRIIEEFSYIDEITADIKLAESSDWVAEKEFIKEFSIVEED